MVGKRQNKNTKYFLNLKKSDFDRKRISYIKKNKFSIAIDFRQGDPLSPILFILCMKCLANTLRDRSLFNG